MAKAKAATSRREQRKLQHQDISRTQLLDAAEEVFGHKGFHETTLKEVAELAEFSVGSVYSFFENKDDLFRQIFLRRGDEFMADLPTALGPDGTSALEQLHRLVDFEIGWFRSHPNFGRLVLRYASASSLAANRAIDEAIASNYQESMRIQSSIFARGQDEGVLRPGDPQVLARIFSGIISGVQAVDPAVVEDATGQLSLEELHDLIERAFAAELPAAGATA
jgi:AcrR family transcriptional regulator